jgi:uncharacterized lipoprotein YddW (UPF0748 family)
MTRQLRILFPLVGLLILITFGLVTYAGRQEASQTMLPVVLNPAPDAMVELRGLWVTRFDWTVSGQPAQPGKIDEIVANAAAAGFNAIFFQVRGTADAFYQPGPEPWSHMVSGGSLGQPPNPYWDPLAYFIQRAHENGIQLHAYINVYPVWTCTSPPPIATPEHFYYKLQNAHGSTGSTPNGLQWATNGDVCLGSYWRATPASVFADNHYLAVAQYLADNYAIDGLHLDHIRYGARTTSCDPVSATASGVPCFSQPPAGYGSYEDWQRAQINGTVHKFYDQIIQNNPNLWLSAAAWPIYILRPEWNWPPAQQGYHDYYQDSKAWVLGGYIDSIMPMIYGGSYWTFDRWQTLVADFQADSGGRFIVPGIGASLTPFSEIENRINAARSLGTAGHAIFSYGQMLANDYFDDLAGGPYALPAVPPQITWHGQTENSDER